ncbi:MAG: hypothetical protein LPK07_11875 [Hymenobacteraceae bacterium]|mgnify:CR=1 FL=1|nr:hypothetical protein [Hymenobacteraceae bacterium]MDX5482370.1 hypothetical protein [Hymenobacteraceae bacterium]
MKLTVTKHRPQPKHFALTLAVTLLLYTLLCGLVFLFFHIASDMTAGELWQDLSSSTTVWLFPVLGGIMHAFSFQRHTLTITGIDDPAKVANWAVSFLLKEGLQVVSKQGAKTVLATQNRYYRLFSYWLGAELVNTRYTADQVIISGHYRHIDQIDSKIKFGKPVFN